MTPTCVRMKKSKFVLIVGMLALLTGCGLGKKPREADPVGVSGINALQLRIVAAGEDPVLPALDPGKGQAPELIVDGDQTYFKKTVGIPPQRSGHPLFLLWSEDLQGAAIRDAHFEHRVQDPMNRNWGAPDRHPASFDERTRRWFVPFSRFYRSENEIDPSEVHWVRLDLQLQDGTRREFQLLFKLRGPVPLLKPSLLPPENPALTVTQGWAFRREAWENPTRQSLSLWIRASEGVDFTLRTYLSLGRYIENPDRPPTGPVYENHLSTTGLQFARIRVKRGAGVEALSPGEEGWFRVELHPGERIEVEYLAFPVRSSQACAVPQAVQRLLHWTTMTRSHCFGARGGDCSGGELVTNQRAVNEEWRVSGVRVAGGWQQQLILTDGRMEAREVLGLEGDSSPGRAESLGAGLVTVQSGLGLGAPGSQEPQEARPLSCQGYF